MYRRMLILTVSIGIVLAIVIIGCKKKTQEPVEVKTEAQYEAEAEKEITDENMDAELQKLEKEIETDAVAE